MQGKIYLKMYVINKEGSRSKRDILRLNEIMENNFKGNYEIVVVDLLLDPDEGEEDRILAAPTVVKKSPLPPQKIIGSLIDEEKVLAGLDLRPEDL